VIFARESLNLMALIGQTGSKMPAVPDAELSPASRTSRGNICSFRRFSKKWGETQKLARLSPKSRNGGGRGNFR
jgi:hypothetical protein